MKRTYFVENMNCGGCAKKITKALEVLEGITSIQTDVTKKQVIIQANTLEDEMYITALDEIGFTMIVVK